MNKRNGLLNLILRIGDEIKMRRKIKRLLKIKFPLYEGRTDGKFHPEDYAMAYCWKCGEDKVVYSKGLTRCRDCGTILYSCSTCEGCDYEDCFYGTALDRFPKLAARLLVNDDISYFECDKFLAYYQMEEEKKWHRAIQAGELPF